MDSESFLNALLTLPALYSPAISPDRKWIAWTWFRTAPTAEVYLAPTDGSAAPTRLTDTPQNTFLAGWSPDSQSVIVVQDRDGDERFRAYRVEIHRPGEMTLLTDDDPQFFMRSPQLHPNGRWLIYGANYDFENDQPIEPTWMIRHDLETGERKILSKPEKQGYVFPVLSPDGQNIVYNRKDRHAAGRQVWLVDINGENDREILNLGDETKVFPSWLPDSQCVLLEHQTDTHTRVGLWSLADETVTWLLDDPQRNVEDVFAPRSSDQLVVTEVRRAVNRSLLLDPTTGDLRTLPDSPGNLGLIGQAADGAWLAVYSSSQHPADIVRVDLKNLAPENFESVSRVWDRTDINPDDLAAAQDFTWNSTDGLEIQGWLYRPSGDARGTVVYVHGGPTSHSSNAINNQIQYFVQQGFNVLDPNYRGSTGFSAPFRESIKFDGWGGMEQEDIRTGIRALIDAGIAKPGQIGITGTSYGGYSSWHAITHFDTDTLAASAPICGMTDLIVDYETTRPDLRPYSEEMMGGTPDDVPEKYHERSPINFVQNVRGRLMIVQGMRDPNVTPDNVRVVTEKLNDSGVEFELLAFDDEGHGISRPANQRHLYPALADFFRSAFN